MRFVIALVLSLVVSASALAAGDEDRQKAWRELFEQADPAASAKHIDAVLAACDNKVEPLKTLIASDSAYSDFKALWLKQTTTVRDGKTDLKTEFLIRVPKDYSTKKSWPLILAAHGQGDSGEGIGSMMEELMGEHVEKYVLVCPTMPGEPFYNGRPYQEQAYLQPLAWARRRLNIDADRISITGYSQGGRVTWHLATMQERLFAAAVPIAGVQWFEGGPYTTYSYLENLAKVPLWAIWGDKDTAAPPLVGNVEVARETAARMKQLKNTLFTPTEMPGAGHGDSFPGRDVFVKYLAANKRAAPPEAFAHAFHLPHHARGYYIEAIRFARQPLAFDKELRVEIPVRPGVRPPTTQEIRSLMQKTVDAGLFRISARLDRAANSLAIRADGVTAVRVYVIDGMFDLAKPVKITFGDKSWTGAIPASPACILKHYAAERDRTQLIVNEVEIDETGKATIGWKAVGSRSRESGVK